MAMQLVLKAPRFDDVNQVSITNLLVHDNKLYGTVYGCGELVEWNGVDAWVVKAQGAYSDNFSNKNSIVSYNGKIYGVGCNSGRLLEWNGVDTWVSVAPLLSSGYGYSLCVFNNKIYATVAGGKLYEWNGTDAWTSVASALNSQTECYSLCVFNSELYAVTYPNGRLFKWNGTNAWVQMANYLAPVTIFQSLVPYGGYLFGLAYKEGSTKSSKLYRWNGTDAWTKVAESYTGTGNGENLFSDGTNLYAVTSNVFGTSDGKVLKWNGSDAWEQVITSGSTQVSYYCMALFGGMKYVGSGNPSAEPAAASLWIMADLVTETVDPIEITTEFTAEVYGDINAVGGEITTLEVAVDITATNVTVEFSYQEQDSGSIALTYTAYEGSGSFQVGWSIQGYGGAECSLSTNWDIAATGVAENTGIAAIAIGTGLLSISGGASGAITIGAGNLVGTGLAEYVATGSLVIGAGSIAATGNVESVGNVSIVIGPAMLTAAGVPESNGIAAIFVGAAELSITASSGGFGAAALEVDWSISITGTGGVFGTAAITLPAAVINALSAGTTQAHLLYNRWR